MWHGESCTDGSPSYIKKKLSDWKLPTSIFQPSISTLVPNLKTFCYLQQQKEYKNRVNKVPFPLFSS